MKTFPKSVLRFSVGIALMSQVSIARSEVIFEESFDACCTIEPIVATFDLPGPGRFRVTATNPDLSLDGFLYVELLQDGERRFIMEGIYFGYTEIPAFNGQITLGVATRVFEFSAPQSIVDLGSLDYRLRYFANGIENAGINMLRVEYIPLSIGACGTALLTITSPPGGTPCEPPEGTLSFDAGDGGILVLRKTSIGSGGGGIEVYVDSIGYGHSAHDGPPTPVYYTVAVSPGTHDLKVRHNDTVFGDNSGTRTEEVYFCPSTSIPDACEDCDPDGDCCPADLDCDGDVDAADLAILLGSWGECTE